MKSKKPKKSIPFKRIILIGLALAFTITLYLFTPQSELKTDYNIPPHASNEPINPLCNPITKQQPDHSSPVIVFYHGFTNCPKQFEIVADLFYKAGYSVYVPLYPHHGHKNRLSDDLKNLTAPEVISFINSSLTEAHMMGTNISVAGLSGGGVMALWIAQYRDDVNLAVSIAPSFDPFTESTLYTPRFRLITTLPNFYHWWDEKNKDAPLDPIYAYPRWSSRSIYSFFQMGKQIYDLSQTTPPRANKTLLITNANDTAVHNEIANTVMNKWMTAGASNLYTYNFDIHYKLGHDLIDPHQPDQKVHIVYPILFEQIDKLVKNRP